MSRRTSAKLDATVRLTLVLAVALAAGCIGGSSHPAGTGPRTLVIGNETTGTAIDPAVAYSPTDGPLLSLTNDGLVGYRRASGSSGEQLVPDLATTIPRATDGGRTWVFHLRSGIRYSTGQRVVASDARRAIERDFVVGSRGLFAMEGLVGAKLCLQQPGSCSLSHGIVADDATGLVTFHLTEPDYEFPFKLALPMADLLPAGTSNVVANVNPLPATGPYRIARYQPGSQLVLVRNSEFHVWSAAAQPQGYPDRIVFRFGLSQSALFSAVASGSASVAATFTLPPKATFEALTSRDAVRRVDFPETSYISLNTRIAPFDRLAARQALRMVIDQRSLARKAGFGVLPTCRVLPPGMPGYVRGCAYPPPDWATARRLVEASGTAGMRVGLLTSGSKTFRTVDQAIVRALDRIGYRAFLRVVSLQSELATVNDSKSRTQIGFIDWAADYPGPTNFLTPLLACRSFVPRSPSNLNASEYCDPGLDAAVRRAVAAGGVEPASQAARWAAIDRRIVAAAPLIPLFTPMHFGVASRSARDVEWNPTWFLLPDLIHPR